MSETKPKTMILLKNNGRALTDAEPIKVIEVFVAAVAGGPLSDQAWWQVAPDCLVRISEVAMIAPVDN